MVERTNINSASGIRGGSPLLLTAAVVGGGAGLTWWAFRRRSHSRWEQAGHVAKQVVQKGREEIKPWMLMTAGSTAGAAVLTTYLRKRVSRRQTRWQRLRKRMF